MSSTYSTNLALELIGTGDQAGTWGVTTNTNLGTLIEQAISGYVTQAITDGADTVITIPNGATGVARNMYIECTGALTAARNLIVPSNKKLYFIYNNTTGGYAVTVKVSGQTGVSVPNGKKVVLVSNGTDVVSAENYIASLSLGSALATTSGGTGLTSGTSGGVLYYSGSTTLASSGALTANALVIGGGAGSAPSTTTTGTGVLTALGVNVGSAGSFIVNGGAGAFTTITASSTASFADGSAASPSITFSSDTDTGFYRIGANTLGVSIAGALAAMFDSSANLQLGKNTSDGYRVGAYGTTQATSGYQLTYGGVGAATLTVASGGALVFGYDGSTGSSERMRINSSGYLGINTNNPEYRIDSVGSVRVAETAAGNGFEVVPGSTVITTAYNRTSSTWLAYRHRALQHEFYANGSEAARIDASGNLLVGTASSSAISGFSGSAIGQTIQSGTPVLALVDSDNTNSYVTWLANSGGDTYLTNKNSSGSLIFGTNGVEKARIDSYGNLGLGVTPAAWGNGYKALQIGTGLSPSLSYVDGLDAAQNAYFDGSNWKYFATGYNAGRYTIAGSASGNASHIWRTAGTGTAGNTITWTQALTLDGNGDLGLGTTPSGAANIETATSKQGVAWFNTTASGGGYLLMTRNGDKSVLFGHYGSTSGGGSTINTDAAFIRSANGIGFGSAGASVTAFFDTSNNFLVGAGSNTSRGGAATRALFYRSSGTNYIDVQTSTSDTGGILFSDGSTGNYGSVQYDHASDVMQFYTAAAEKARIDSSGNLLVGTATAVSKFTLDSGYITAGTATATNSAKLLGGAYSGAHLPTLGAEKSSGGPVLGYAVWPSTSAADAFVSSANINAYRCAYTIADEHKWYVGAAQTVAVDSAVTTTRAMTLTNGGNLGVGTASPAVYSGYTTLAINNATNGGLIDLMTNGTRQLTMYAGAATSVFGTTTSTNLSFITYNTERARITSDGSFLVGTTSSGNRIAYIKGSASSTYACTIENTSATAPYGIQLLNSGVTGGAGSDFIIAADNSTRFKVNGNGNVENVNNAYGAISDIKLKENIIDATPKLEALNQVRIVNFNLIGEEQKQLGVIAQELEQIFPNMVSETSDFDEDGNDLGTTTKSVKYSVFVPMLIKAMQEQQVIITDLRARVEALETA